MGDRGFAGARWSPEDHGGNFSLFDRRAQDTSFANEMFLSH